MLVTLGVVLALVVAGGALAGSVLRDSREVRGELVAVETELDAARAAIAGGDVDGAAARILAADTRVRPLAAVVASPRWRLAAAVPVAGEPVALARAIVETAAAGTELAAAALELGGPEALAGVDLRVGEGRVDLAPLTAAAELVRALPTARLEAALAALDGASVRRAPAELVDARTRLLVLGGEALRGLEATGAVLDVVPALLGADGERRHLLVLQTSAELRGTGGMVGATTVLSADDGAVRLATVAAFSSESERAPEDGVLVDTDGLGGALAVPAPVDPAVVTRYGYVGVDVRVSNANVDPDLATSAGALLAHVEARTGQRLDGVVLLDPIGLGAVLTALDVELVVPEGLRAGTDAPERIAPEDFARYALIDLYDDFGEARSAERDVLVAELATQAFTAMFARDWDARRVTDALTAAAVGRHLQVHSVRDDEAAVLRRLPIGGDLAGALTRPTVDTVAVTANNAVGGKQDVHLGHRHVLRVVLGPPGVARTVSDAADGGAEGADGAVMVREAARVTTLATTTVNPLVPGAFDRYVTGNCLVGLDRWGCFDGPEAANRTWWSVWLPGGDDVGPVRGPEGLVAVGRGTFHGARVVDPYVEVPAAGADGPGAATFTLSSSGTVLLEDHGDRLVYRLGWWRQAKAVPDLVDVVVLAPPGWRVADAALTGGPGRLPLLGVDAGLEPARLMVEGDRVRVVGTIGRDALIEVALVPAG